MTLDLLSNGRLILGVGIGDGGASVEAFGDSGEARVRAEKLDESLEIITRLWSGDEVTHRGPHYVVEAFTLAAQPVQRPRIPIWVGGDSAPALRRAARWDGWIGPDKAPGQATLDQLNGVCNRLAVAGAAPNFDVAWAGNAGEDESVADYGAAGATWWIVPAIGTRDQVLQQAAAGPPGAERD